MLRELTTSLILFLFLMLLTGLAYPLLTWGVGQTLFPHQAEGGLIEENGKIIGAHFIAQGFAGDSYFHPRPSAAGDQGYDASNSSGSNLGPTSTDLIKAVSARVLDLRKTAAAGSFPVDLVTTSASGLDPHISPAAARFQAPRVASARHLDIAQVEDLISQHTESRTFGVLGENRVNVLELNRALDHLAPLLAPKP